MNAAIHQRDRLAGKQFMLLHAYFSLGGWTFSTTLAKETVVQN